MMRVFVVAAVSAVLCAVLAPAEARVGFEFETNVYRDNGYRPFSKQKYTVVRSFRDWSVQLDVVRNSARLPTKNDMELVTKPFDNADDACSALKEVAIFLDDEIAKKNEAAKTASATSWELDGTTDHKFHVLQGQLVVNPQATVAVSVKHLARFGTLYFESQLGNLHQNVFSRKLKKIVDAINAFEDTAMPGAYKGFIMLVAEYIAAGLDDSNYPKESIFFMSRSNMGKVAAEVKRIIGKPAADKYMTETVIFQWANRAAKHGVGCTELDGKATRAAPLDHMKPKCDALAKPGEGRLFPSKIRYGPFKTNGPTKKKWLAALLAGEDPLTGMLYGSMGALPMEKVAGDQQLFGAQEKSGVIFEIRGLQQNTPQQKASHTVKRLAYAIYFAVQEFNASPDTYTASKINELLGHKNMNRCSKHKRKGAMTAQELGPLLQETVTETVDQKLLERYYSDVVDIEDPPKDVELVD